MRADAYLMGQMAVVAAAVFALIATWWGIWAAGQPVSVRARRREIESALDRGLRRTLLIAAGLLTLAVSGRWLGR